MNHLERALLCERINAMSHHLIIHSALADDVGTQ